MHGPENSIMDGQLHSIWEFDWSQVMHIEVLVCSIVLFLSGILCSAAGIGGGGVYVAVLMVIGLLSPHDAVPLSKAIVFFGAMITLVLNLVRMDKTPASKAGGINFNTVRVVAPASLAGTFLGVLFNWHVEGYMIVVLLSLLLTFMTYMVGKAAWEQHCHEEATLEGGGDYDTPQSQEDMPLIPATVQAVKVEADTWSTADTIISVALLILVVASGVLRFHLSACLREVAGDGIQGSCDHWTLKAFFGERSKSTLLDPTFASNVKFSVTLLPLLTCLIICGWFGHSVHTRAAWSTFDVFTYQAMACITGLFAGLVGVGGGLIFSPFFLLMGMDPASAVATSSTCVLFTSSSTTLQYMLNDRVMMSLAVVYGLATFVASYFGTNLVHTLQDAFHGKKSYITTIVALAVGASAVMTLGKLATMWQS